LTGGILGKILSRENRIHINSTAFSRERINGEIRRRTDMVGVFPSRSTIIRLAGTILGGQNDEWTVSRRYILIAAPTRNTINSI